MKSTFLGRAYLDGEVICRQGEMADCMYVIQEGKVEFLYRKGEQEFCLGTMEIDDFFGEPALLEEGAHRATARAVGLAIVLSIERRAFLHRIHEDASFAMKIIRKMSRRIRQLEDALIASSDVHSLISSMQSGTAGKAPGGG